MSKQINKYSNIFVTELSPQPAHWRIILRRIAEIQAVLRRMLGPKKVR
jgi:hypothetical protein